MLAQRRAIIDVHKRAAQADVIILTLGLVEAWFDKQTLSYLNIPPWGQFGSDRFELRVTDYTENRKSLQQLIELLRAACKPDLKVILTVSPVPLKETFSGQDIVVANAYSKSVLRAVAQDIALENPNTDYFPSYEMVTLAAPDAAWRVDRRHVRRDFVRLIVSSFLSSYVRDSVQPAHHNSSETGRDSPPKADGELQQGRITGATLDAAAKAT